MAGLCGVLRRGQGAGKPPISVWSGSIPIKKGNLFGLWMIARGRTHSKFKSRDTWAEAHATKKST